MGGIRFWQHDDVRSYHGITYKKTAKEFVMLIEL